MACCQEGRLGVHWRVEKHGCGAGTDTCDRDLAGAGTNSGHFGDAERSGFSYEGLYYSTDSGATWHLATITDGSGEDVQGPVDAFAEPDGNAATSVVWNPVRQLFVAAVRFHGYYQSPNGVTWTRMAAQPGANLTTGNCPNSLGGTGNTDCPIFRGALAVNFETGDTFAWTVDRFYQDQGYLWQDQCSINIAGTACTNTSITFAKQWSTASLDASTSDGSTTILNGDYNLALAAVPYATAVSVPLSGSGLTTFGLNVNPPQLIFSPQSPGLPSPPQTVSIINSSSVAASTPSLLINNTQFSLTANTCNGNLAAGANCTVGVIYTPTATLAAGSTATGILTASSTTFTTQATVALSGMAGGAGSIQTSPSPISFGTVGVNGVSNPVTVTITNPWTTTAMEGLTLTFPAGFQAASNTNTCTTTLGPGASCTVGVVFAPATAGAQSGTLSITSSTASASGSVALLGNGFDFSVSVSGSNTQTVAAGQVAYYTISIAPLPGSPGGTFSYTCGTLPANALCIFDPTGESVAAGGTGYLTVEVSTGQSTTSSTTSSLTTGPPGGRVLPLACGLILLPLALTSAWKRRRKFLLMGALLAIVAGSLSSCVASGGGTGGGGGGGSGNSGLTPPGTYTITVNVISNGVTHALAAPTGPLTLTVD